VAVWLTIHRVLLNRGFLIKRHGLGTDTLLSLVIAITTTLWTIFVLYLGADSSEGRETGISFLASIAAAPWLLQILSIFWLIAWFDGLHSARSIYAHFHLWNLSSIAGPFEWSSSLNPGFYYCICCTLIAVILPLSLAAIACGFTSRGVLNIIGLVVFLATGTGPNPYVKARHRYAGDMLRIALPTSHHEGTTYILPSKNYGFDAVWTPKVQNEHIEADDQAMELFRSIRSGEWSLKEPLERIRSIVSAYQEKSVLGQKQILDIARWLYLDSDCTTSMRSIRCERPSGVHLIGRDLMYALCHAEYLVFMAQETLPKEQRDKLGMLRLMKRSGGTQTGAEVPTVGYHGGLRGFSEAIDYIYQLFDQPRDDPNEIGFLVSTPPKYSNALSKSPESITEYVEALWDLSCQHSESTFTAFYMFTVVWSVEVGNVNGFHLFPFRARSHVGDLTSLQIVWRQAWYCSVISQLIAVSPLFFGLFVAGYLH
jgi:hypothetical protein